MKASRGPTLVSKSPAPLRLFLAMMFDGVLQGRTAGA